MHAFNGMEAEEIIMEYGTEVLIANKINQRKNWVIWASEQPPGIGANFWNTPKMKAICEILEAYSNRYVVMRHQGSMMSAPELIRSARGTVTGQTGYAPIRSSATSSLATMNPVSSKYGNFSTGLSEPWESIFVRVLGGVFEYDYTSHGTGSKPDASSESEGGVPNATATVSGEYEFSVGEYTFG